MQLTYHGRRLWLQLVLKDDQTNKDQIALHRITTRKKNAFTHNDSFTVVNTSKLKPVMIKKLHSISETIQLLINKLHL